MNFYEMPVHARKQIHRSARNNTAFKKIKFKPSAKCASANTRFDKKKNLPVNLQKLSRIISLSAPMITTETKESDI